MTVEMLEGLTRLFRELGRDKTVFHIVLAAKGKYFCTGMDFSGDTDRTSAQGNYYGLVRGLFAAIEEAPQTTIAVIHGPAYGGGVGLAFACDVRIASRKARFTLSEVKLGLQPAVISRVDRTRRTCGVMVLMEIVRLEACCGNRMAQDRIGGGDVDRRDTSERTGSWPAR